MTFYKIEETDLSIDKDTYFIYQGSQELEVKLNSGFSAARELLECVHYLLNDGKQVVLHIVYYEERISYYVQSSDPNLLDYLNHSTVHLRWAKERNEINSQFATDKVTLIGSASPIILKDREENPIDELVRLSQKEPFLIQIKLESASPELLTKQMSLLEKHINEISKETEKQVGEQGHIGEHFKKFLIGGENLSYQQTNSTAKQQVELLENHLYMLNCQGGIFSSAVFNIYASKKSAPMIAAHLERASKRSGSLNHYRLRKGEKYSVDYLNLSSVNGIASLLALPMEPMPGIKQHARVPFGADVVEYQENKVELGHLMTSYETRIPVSIPLKDLTKHMFISGVTGSGKTSSVKTLLVQAFHQKVPFLVLEPAKTEYKYLDAQLTGLRRYTLGIEGKLSFKMNPFEFPNHIHIQTHVDHLKSVFIAAFPMYGPMPYILETAFYQIYRRTGWDFISGRNVFEETLARPDLFPTLEDLYMAIDEAIEAVGYSTDLSNDIRGALKVRIGSLLSGAKGTMLNTREGHSVATLLATPTIMELEYIGDDQEKVFLMGLLLIAIYEHYVSLGEPSSSLKHLLVIEEAHRLLENTRSSGSQESADMKGKAVETFNNMLSEIRAYGQGLIVADQIPTKLSADIIKNTNLKMIHKLYAKDDRQMIGDSIGLTDEQVSELIRLQQGEAVIFHGRIEAPIKVKINVDRSILAEDQLDTRRLEKTSIHLENYLLQNDSFRHTCFKLINTFILFPEAEPKIHEFLMKEVQSVIFNAVLSDAAISSLWLKAIDMYYREKRVFEKIAYPLSVELSKWLSTSSSPLQYFGEWIRDMFGHETQIHPMARFSNVFESFRLFRELEIYQDEQLVSNVTRRKEELHYENSMVNQLLIKQSKSEKKLLTQLLTFDQKQHLCYAMLLYEFEDFRSFLEQYFNIKSVGIAGITQK